MESSRDSDLTVQRPLSLAYALDERPPHAVLAGMAVQHLIILSGYLVLPMLVISATGVKGDAAVDYVRMSLVVTGVSTLLQCLTRGPVGSGYGVPHLPAPIFFGAAIIAAKTGGLDLISGMTLFAGILMALIAIGLERMQALLPTEVIGSIVLMVGVSLLPSGLQGMLAAAPGLPASSRPYVLAVSLSSFAIMAGVTMSGSRMQRLGLLIGVAAGTILSLALGIVNPERGGVLGSARWIALPLPGSLPRLGFAWSLVPVFAVAALASCAKSVGDLTVFQKAGNADWVRPDLAPLRRGVLASALGTCMAGALGSLGMGTSTACIGLSIATRTMSRAIAVLVGLLAIVLGCIPVLAALFLLIPEPVQGAMVLFVVCFLMISGFQLITARMLNTRRTFVVGTSLAAGLGVQIVPPVFHGLVPAALESGIILTALVALLLNYLTGLGSRGATELELTAGPGVGRVIFRELERLGGAWGARKDVIWRVAGALNEIAEMLALRPGNPKFRVSLRYDEDAISARAVFAGPPLDLPAGRPPDAALLENKAEVYPALAGYLIRAFCTKIEQTTAAGETVIGMVFQH